MPTQKRTYLTCFFTLLFSITLIITTAYSQSPPLEYWKSENRVHVTEGTGGAVSTICPIATRIGRDILAKGGNAVDASIAIAYALAVTWPEAGNIGGGGFMLVAPTGSEPVCIEYREKAPLAAHANMFGGKRIYGTGLAIGVPGTVRGLELAHQTYGSLPWAELVAPAIELARDGFEIKEQLVYSLNRLVRSGKVNNDPRYAELKRTFVKPNRALWKVGNRLVQPDLAKTLTLIAEQGSTVFYEGEIAKKLVAQMSKCDGLITHQDMRAYTANIRPTVKGNYRSYDIYGAGMPTSGGTTVIEILNILENFELSNHPLHSTESIHLIAEAMRFAYADRAKYLGDHDFIGVPNYLLDKEYAKSIAAKIDMASATRSEDIASPIKLAEESQETTHFSVIDKNGMAVSNTYTIGRSWGEWIMVEGAGFVLNSEMLAFNLAPGVTNEKGLIGTKANRVEPGKRMLSSLAPTIVKKDGKVVLVTGSPGGRTIINVVVSFLTNVIDYDLPLDVATSIARVHHQWLPDRILFEGYGDPAYADVIEQLEAYGHVVKKQGWPLGTIHSIQVLGDRVIGVADWRRGGTAEVVEPLVVNNKKADVATGTKGMVVSVSPEASMVGKEVIEKGGNAVDAAVAVGFALAVTWPEAGNIGGGGFMMVSPTDGETVMIDYREKAPLAATRDMFVGQTDRWNYLNVGVPGTVRGLALAHEKYGKLPWKELVMPAVKLAKDGFTVDQELADSINSVMAEKRIKDDALYAPLRDEYGRANGKIWRKGDRIVLPELGQTLELIANQGSDAFYEDKIADQLVAAMKANNGIITKEDLEKYEAVVRPAVIANYRGYEIYGPPLPSSGGIVLTEVLNILENFDLSKYPLHSPESIHLITEAMRYGFADRAKYLGDSDFVEVPRYLTTKAYAKKIAAKIKMRQAAKSEDIAAPIVLKKESDDTTHYSIIDGDGMAVSNTYTLEQSWGAKVVVKGAGFVLNNEMGDFNWNPGVTNRGWKIGTKANTIEPEKRMLSSMTPVIVKKQGEVVLVTGSPGGRTIINTVLSVLINVIDYKMDVVQAVESERVHHQWFPDVLNFEGNLEPEHVETMRELEQYGHTVRQEEWVQGDAHSIGIEGEEMTGVGDWRRSGKAEAVE
ncbi:gamma-glutamyltransferase [Planctomycetota bacterium]|nr:gamma-glutamyltransferase [Planctomycetota bacterium]